MKPRDLLGNAEVLLKSGNGRPTDVSLRRATSAAYYALFHCLARECANLLIGVNKSNISSQAWRQVYRALDHNTVVNQCKNETIKKFPKEIEDFANQFTSMQKKRHSADYDPFTKFVKSEVIADIQLTENAITLFESAPKLDRRAFCAFVLLKRRSN